MRRQPVAFALIDAAFLADSKFRRLRKRLIEPKDFNSAVGAWLIVLTSARRNGLPNVDAADEAEDQTFLPDLIAVGLLTETGIPEEPFRAWAPARPKYPNERTATDVTDSTDVTNGTVDTGATSLTFPTQSHVSTPFPSTPLTSTPKKRPRARRFSTVDNDPVLSAIRAEQVAAQAAKQADPPEPPMTHSRNGAAALDAEREAQRKEALALHEQFARGEMTEAVYARRRQDIGKQPDDLTRYEVAAKS